MLYTEEQVRANIRNREGKRVFYLGKGDNLTSGARDYLRRERIPILPAEQAAPGEYRMACGAVLREKPEHMTHLNGDVLVLKTHPMIRFRGAVDTLEAALLLGQLRCGRYRKELEEILGLARKLIRCEVMGEEVKQDRLCGLTEAELRRRSHRPQEFYGQPHFMPEVSDGETVLELNWIRCAVRATELAAAEAFTDPDGCCSRPDILQALNRMSSMVYLLMIDCRANP